MRGKKPHPLSVEPPHLSDIDMSEDMEARAKIVKCSYKGGCNMWFYNKEGICDPCHFNTKE